MPSSLPTFLEGKKMLNLFIIISVLDLLFIIVVVATMIIAKGYANKKRTGKKYLLYKKNGGELREGEFYQLYDDEL